MRVALDLGCGTGRFSAMLARVFGAEVVGVDPSASMLQTARERVGEPLCRFLVGAAESIPLETGTIDLVFMSMIYHHVRDWPRAHVELRRVLRESGRVVIRTPLKEQLDRYFVLRFFPAARAVDEDRLPSGPALVAAMSAGGFELLHQSTVSHRTPETREEILKKVEMKSISALRLISEEDFRAGFAQLQRSLETMDAEVLRAARADGEPLALFCFEKKRGATQ